MSNTKNISGTAYKSTITNDNINASWLTMTGDTVTANYNLYVGTTDVMAEINTKQDNLDGTIDVTVNDLTSNSINNATTIDTASLTATDEIDTDVLTANTIQTTGTEIAFNTKLNMGSNEIFTSGIYNSSNAILTTGDVGCTDLVASANITASGTITGDGIVSTGNFNVSGFSNLGTISGDDIYSANVMTAVGDITGANIISGTTNLLDEINTKQDYINPNGSFQIANLQVNALGNAGIELNSNDSTNISFIDFTYDPDDYRGRFSYNLTDDRFSITTTKVSVISTPMTIDSDSIEAIVPINTSSSMSCDGFDTSGTEIIISKNSNFGTKQIIIDGIINSTNDISTTAGMVCDDLAVAKAIRAEGSLIGMSNLFVGTTSVLTGDITALSDLTVSGDVMCQHLTCEDVNMTGSIHTTGSISSTTEAGCYMGKVGNNYAFIASSTTNNNPYFELSQLGNSRLKITHDEIAGYSIFKTNNAFDVLKMNYQGLEVPLNLVVDGATTCQNLNVNGTLALSNQLTLTDDLDVTGTITGSDDLFIGGDVLHVDTSINKVGINVLNPTSALQVVGARDDTTELTGGCVSMGHNSFGNYGIEIASPSGNSSMIDFTHDDNFTDWKARILYVGNTSLNIKTDTLPIILDTQGESMQFKASEYFFSDTVGKTTIGGTNGTSALSVVGTVHNGNTSVAGVHMALQSGNNACLELCSNTVNDLSYIDFTYPNTDKRGRAIYDFSNDTLKFEVANNSQMIISNSDVDFQGNTVSNINLNSRKGQIVSFIGENSNYTAWTTGNYVFKYGNGQSSTARFGIGMRGDAKFKYWVYQCEYETNLSTSCKLVFDVIVNNLIVCYCIVDFSNTTKCDVTHAKGTGKFSSSATSQIDYEFGITDPGYGYNISYRVNSNTSNPHNGPDHRMSTFLETLEDW